MSADSCFRPVPRTLGRVVGFARQMAAKADEKQKRALIKDYGGIVPWIFLYTLYCFSMVRKHYVSSVIILWRALNSQSFYIQSEVISELKE
jgi:hypothetical protein